VITRKPTLRSRDVALTSAGARFRRPDLGCHKGNSVAEQLSDAWDEKKKSKIEEGDRGAKWGG